MPTAVTTSSSQPACSSSTGAVLFAEHHLTGSGDPPVGTCVAVDVSLSVAASRGLLEEAALLAHVHSSPINVGLLTYRCRTAAEPVPHLDVCFSLFADVIAPTLVVSDGLAEPNPSISEVFQRP